MIEFNFILNFLDLVFLQGDLLGIRGEGPLGTADPLVKGMLPSVFAVIGFSITSAEIKKILSSLGCSLRTSGKKIKVLPPTWRPDIKEDIDLIEELIRIKGYDKVPLKNPEKENIKDTLNNKQKLFHFAQRFVASKVILKQLPGHLQIQKQIIYFQD